MALRMRKLISVVLTLTYLLTWTPVSSAAGPDPAQKIHASLRDQSESASVRFLVKLVEQTDTQRTAARTLATTSAKDPASRVAELRRAVVSDLQATAEQSQGALRPLLKAMETRGEITRVEFYWVINAIAVTGTPRAMQRLAALPEVEGVYPDRRIRQVAPESAADPAETIPWNLDLVRAPQAWSQGARGAGVVVASLDTGVDWTHPALKQNFRGYNPADPTTPNTEGNWLDVVGRSSTPYDDIGHGTHTAGTAVGYDRATGRYVGVAPDAKWIAVKAFSPQGAYDSWLMEAGQWLLAPKDRNGVGHPEWAPDVIINSWGGEPGLDEFYRPMVQNWRAAGIFPVFAAGNSGPASYTIEPPGNYPESYAVAAVDQYRNLAPFSSRGPAPSAYGSIIKPNISAPGVSVTSSMPGGGYGTKNGTSMATPHVAGVAALLLSINPSLTPAQLEGALTSSATPLTDTAYPTAPNYGYGAGLVNADAAVASVISGGTVAGTVKDSAGKPLAAKVKAEPRSVEVATDPASGAYSLKLPAGTYTLTVTTYGYEAASATVTVVRDTTTSQSFTLAPKPRGTLAGRVTDAATGLPLSGAAITLAEDPQLPAATTDSDGRYTLQPLVGSYTVRALLTGYETGVASVTVTTGASVTADLALAKPVLRREDWPQFRGEAGHSGYNDSLLAPPLQKAWTTAINPIFGSFSSSPIIAAGRVYVGGNDKLLHALDLESGTELWTLSVGGSYGPSTPVYADGRVIIVNSSGVAYAASALSGQQLWTRQLAGSSSSYAPVASDGKIFVPTGGTVTALNGATGEPVWTRSYYSGSPAVGGGKLYVAGDDSASALDPATGATLWTWRCPCSTPYEVNPVYADGIVLIYTGYSPARLYALDAATGTLRWTLDGAGGYPASRDGIVYAPLSDGRIQRVRLEDGFRLDAISPGAVVGGLGSPAIANGNLYVGSLKVIDLTSGNPIWSLSVSSSLYLPPVVGANRVLILEGGKVTAYAPVSAPPVAATLHGILTDATTQKPISDGSVRLEGTPRSGTADGAGSYSLTAAPGTYTAVARAYGYLESRSDLSLTSGQLLRRDFALQPAPRGSLIGQVVSAADGAPIPGATLRLLDDPKLPPVVTADDGSFRLETFSGTYTLRVIAPTHATLTQTVTVPVGGQSPLPLTLTPFVSRPDDWVSQWGPASHSGQTDSLLSPPLTRSWSTSGLTYTSRPTVADGRVFAMTSSELVALSASSGDILWRTQATSVGSPAYDRNRLYTTDGGGGITAYVADTGERLWQIGLSQWSTRQPVTAKNGRVFVVGAGSGSTLYALDGETGALLWSQPLPSGDSSPAVDGNVVYISQGGPLTYAFDVATGQRLWFRNGCNCTSGGGQVPVVGAGLMLEVDYDTLNALDARTGTLLWSKPGVKGTPVIIDGTVYVNTTSSTTLALNPTNGQTLATLSVTGPLAGANGFLYGNGVAAINLGTRQTIGTYLAGATNVTVAENRVFALDSSGNLVTFTGPTPSAVGTVSGTILGRGTPDLPLPAEVTIGGRTVRTDIATGTFSLRLPVGTYSLQAVAHRYQQASSTVTVEKDKVSTLTLVLDPQVRALLTGRITRSDSGLPVAGARIALVEDPEIPAVFTDAQGMYSIQPYAGTYTLRITAQGLRTASTSITVTSGQTLQRDMELAPAPGGGDCPLDRCTPDRSGQSGSTANPPYSLAWTSTVLPRLNSLYSYPVVGAGMVFAPGQGRSLTALDLLTGQQVWKKDLGTPNEWPPGTPAYGDGLVFIGNRNSYVMALDAFTGEERWRFDLQQHGDPTPPVYQNGRVYIGADGSGATVWALDANTGQPIWSAGAWSTLKALAVGGGRVYSAAYGPRIYAWDQTTGQRLWFVDESAGYSGGDEYHITYADEVLLVGPSKSSGNTISAYNAATGQKLWTTTGNPPAVRGSTVYVHNGTTLRALDLHTGAEQWSMPLTVTGPTLAPVITGDILILGSATAVNLNTRTVVWSTTQGTNISPVAAENYLLLTNTSGYLIAMRGTETPGISVTVGLEYRNDASGVSVMVTGPGGPLSAVTGPNGSVRFSGLAPGTYQVTVTKALYKKAVFTVTVGTSTVPITTRLLAGDIDQNGAIELADLEALRAAWRLGTATLDVIPDGVIDLRDFYALSRNFGK